MQLLVADIEIEDAINALRSRGRLPCSILPAVLRHRGSEFADIMGIVDMDGDGS